MDDLNDLLKAIDHWNENRVPILRISKPDRDLTFKGAMRFYFQDAGQRVATKCVSISSNDTVKDVINVLIEKFRPDMRMLTVAEYGLYEIHENGEERKLAQHERPLLVQLEWNRDDCEGRFLLRRMDERTRELNEEPSLQRKVSKKTKNGKKKSDDSNSITNELANNDKHKIKSIAGKLYKELPETSFTRSISNPEAVMKRRRAQKLEKRLQEAGGTLRIFGEAINKDASYKTLLLSIGDTAAQVVKQILEKYGKENENPNNYCLVQLIVPPTAKNADGNSLLHESTILADEDCPLLINQNHEPSEGVLTFHIRKKPPNYLPRKMRPEAPRAQMEPLPHVGSIRSATNFSSSTLQRQNNISSTSSLPPTRLNEGYKPPYQTSNGFNTINRDVSNSIMINNNNQNTRNVIQQQPHQQHFNKPPGNDQILPALIQVEENVEDVFLTLVISQIKPLEVQFRLAPTYVLYMVSRYRASTLFRPELKAPARAELFSPFTKKIATMIKRAIEVRTRDPLYLAFWMANATDLSYFYKQDKHLSHFTLEAKDILYQSIRLAFMCLRHCTQEELSAAVSTLNEGANQEEVINKILYILDQTMATLKKNRVNAAITIQLFSYLFHHLAKSLYQMYCYFMQLEQVSKWKSLIRSWAEVQGLEQSADYHLGRIDQLVYSGAQPTNEDDFVMEYNMPLLLPEDGYSCEMIRFVPNGLFEFISYLTGIRVENEELCIFRLQPSSAGFWTVYFENHQQDTPEIMDIQLKKKDNSIGLSITSAKAAGSSTYGIYIRYVVKDGAAWNDGRLQAGDQILEVDGNSLIDISEKKAAEIMHKTDTVVNLRVAKQAAAYQNLMDIINDVVEEMPQVSPAQFSHVVQNDIPIPAAFDHHEYHPSQSLPHNDYFINQDAFNVPQKFVSNPNIRPETHSQPNGHQFRFTDQNAPRKSNGKPELINHQFMSFQESELNPVNSTSSLRMPKKVSWVDSQPLKSLHTLIPPSPAPAFNEDYDNYEKQENLHENLDDGFTNQQFIQDPMQLSQSINLAYPSEKQYEKENDEREIDYPLPFMQSATHQYSVKEGNEDFINLQTTVEQNDQVENGNQNILDYSHETNNNNNNNSTSKDDLTNNDNNTSDNTLTLEDIDDVLSSKTGPNWIEDSVGVIGTQEVYNDPRQRIVKERQKTSVTEPAKNTEGLSLKQKIKLFEKQ